MPIKVYRGGQVQQISRATFALYTIGGRGKTTTALSAHNPVLLDFEGSSYRALNPTTHPVVDLGAATWEEIDEYTLKDPEKLIANADTVILDTVTELVRVAIAGIIGRGPAKLKQRDGSPTVAGWTALRDGVFAFYERFTRSGKNVIFTFQPSESVDGDESFTDLAVIGKSNEFVMAKADMIGEIIPNPKGEGNAIDYTMHTKHVAKDPLRWGVVVVPHVVSEPQFMGKEIDRYISEINARKQAEAGQAQQQPQYAAPQETAQGATVAPPATPPAQPAQTVPQTPVEAPAQAQPTTEAPATYDAPQTPPPAPAPPPESEAMQPTFKYFVAGDTRGVEQILFDECSETIGQFNDAWKELATIGRKDFMEVAAKVGRDFGYRYDQPNKVWVEGQAH